MPAEIILESILRILHALLFHTVFFWTGFVFLEIITFGKLDLATQEKFRSPSSQKKRKKNKPTIWLHNRKTKKRQLKPEITASIGTTIWLISLILYLAHKTRS